MNKKATVYFSLFTLLFLVFAQIPAFAQQDPGQLSLSVSPPVFELSANPGESIENEVRLSNLSEEERSISVSMKNFTAQGEEGGVELTEETTNFSLASWIVMGQNKFTIQPKEDKIIKFKVNVPAQAEPGGHFGSILFRSEAEEITGSGAAISPEVGALLLVRVAGDINEKGDIVEFFAEPSIYEKGPFNLVARFKNEGNVHFKPRGTITFSNIFGQEVGNVAFDEQNVLPGSIRRITNEWDPSGFRMGRYTATASLVYGSDDNIANATTTFWVVPWKELGVLLIVLAALSYVGYKYRKRFHDAFEVLRGKKS